MYDDAKWAKTYDAMGDENTFIVDYDAMGGDDTLDASTYDAVGDENTFMDDYDAMGCDDTLDASTYDQMGDNDDGNNGNNGNDGNDGYSAVQDAFHLDNDDSAMKDIAYSPVNVGAKAYGAAGPNSAGVGAGAGAGAGDGDGDAPTRGKTERRGGGGFQRKPSIYQGFDEAPSSTKAYENTNC